jgi:hypothetical protein
MTYHPEDFAQAAMQRRCATCDAPPGEWCVTKRGTRAPFLHAWREQAEIAARYGPR